MKVKNYTKADGEPKDKLDAIHREVHMCILLMVKIMWHYNVILHTPDHHHHRDAKRSAGASRRCDRSPERSVLR